MQIKSVRLCGIRCFEDTGEIELHPRCNVFVGKNNVGKSTILKSIYGMQGDLINHQDIRANSAGSSFLTANFCAIDGKDVLLVGRDTNSTEQRYTTVFKGDNSTMYSGPHIRMGSGQPWFSSARGNHSVVPFISKRKSTGYDHTASLASQSTISGTLSNLFGRIDLVAVSEHPLNKEFMDAVNQIVGIPITTAHSNSGKHAGFYFDQDNFIPLDRMGEGVSEMLAQIVELCVERNKIFVLDEPETSIHPQGLKALLSLIRKASERNQFLIATHSNIVVRELGDSDIGKIFRVYRDGEKHTSPSKVQEVGHTTPSRVELLRELGYEFSDLELHEAWLFLEESSAEQIIRDVLIPKFTPELKGRLRTFSTSGVNKLKASVEEFRRLVTFIHLQPAYDGNIWIRTDGDSAGLGVVAEIKVKFPQFDDTALAAFSKSQFEEFYPAKFSVKVAEVLQIADKNSKKQAKAVLLRQVLDWTISAPIEALKAWQISAHEPISLLKSISAKLENGV